MRRSARVALRGATIALPLAATGIARELDAQAARPPQLEARADAIFATTDVVHAGVGAALPLGNYVRLGLVGAGGVAFDGERTRPSARVDAAARFLLDPLRQSRWGPYGGGGLSLRHEESTRWRGYLLLFFGVEGPALGGRIYPALELGLGGGTRVGMALRRAPRARP